MLRRGTHQADHNEAGEAARTQRHHQRFPGRPPRRARHAHVGPNRDPHACGRGGPSGEALERMCPSKQAGRQSQRTAAMHQRVPAVLRQPSLPVPSHVQHACPRGTTPTHPPTRVSRGRGAGGAQGEGHRGEQCQRDAVYARRLLLRRLAAEEVDEEDGGTQAAAQPRDRAVLGGKVALGAVADGQRNLAGMGAWEAGQAGHVVCGWEGGGGVRVPGGCVAVVRGAAGAGAAKTAAVQAGARTSCMSAVPSSFLSTQVARKSEKSNMAMQTESTATMTRDTLRPARRANRPKAAAPALAAAGLTRTGLLAACRQRERRRLAGSVVDGGGSQAL